MLLDFKIVNPICKNILEEISNMVNNRSYERLAKEVGEGICPNVFAYKGFALKIYNDLGVFHDSEPMILEKLQGNKTFVKLFAYVPEVIMITEYIEGETFDKAKEKGILLSPDWAKDIKKALQYARDQHFIPNDVVQRNVMLTKEGLPIIIDVGDFDNHSHQIRDDMEIVGFLRLNYHDY